jgi:ubiquinone/menaquinone biosynthesis C-methylase UbiE
MSKPGIIQKFLSRDEKVCPWWMAWTFDNPLRRWLHDPQRILGSHIEEGMTVADIGCGMGYFSVAMARMVGADGNVIAVDVQQMMLDLLKKRAYRAGVRDRVTTVLAVSDDIRIERSVDFVLAFWMIHEVKDIPRFFGQVAAVLRPGGCMLYAEPRMHVTKKRFDEILAHAKSAGFILSEGPQVGMSRAVVLVRGER